MRSIPALYRTKLRKIVALLGEESSSAVLGIGRSQIQVALQGGVVRDSVVDSFLREIDRYESNSSTRTVSAGVSGRLAKVVAFNEAVGDIDLSKINDLHTLALGYFLGRGESLEESGVLARFASKPEFIGKK